MTVMLLKIHDDWVIMAQAQKTKLTFRAEDIQETKYLQEDSLTQSMFPEPVLNVANITDSDSTVFNIAEEWPVVGQTYYYLHMPTPYDIEIQSDIVTTEIAANYQQSQGNIYQTYDEAATAARKLIKFFAE